MANKYLVCRHCTYYEDERNDATCLLHKKRINPGVACCDDIAPTKEALERLSQKQKNNFGK